jgi:tetratricopeptide (TPR) repeat protein
MRHSGLARVLSAAALLSSAAVSFACRSNPTEETGRYLASGTTYAQAGKCAEAAIEFRNALKIDPRLAEARLGLANCHEQLGDRENALRELVRAADLLPAEKDVQLRAGEALWRAGFFEDARARAERVLKQDLGNVKAHVLLGNALAGLKDFDGAVKALEQATDTSGTGNVKAFTRLGVVHGARGDTGRAETAFQEAVRRAPRATEPRLALANLYWSSGERAKAEAVLREVADLAPNDPMVTRALALLALASNRVADAEAFLRAAASKGDTPARLALGDLQASLQQHDNAERTFRALLADAAVRDDAAVRLARLLFDTGRAQEAFELVRSVRVRQATHVDALTTEAGFFIAEGRAEDARRLAQRALELAPNAPRAHYLIGQVFVAEGRLGDAVSSFRKVIALNPSAADAHVQLADLYLRRSEFAAAEQAAHAAVQLSPQWLPARLTFVRALLAAGNVSRASDELKPALERAPSSASVRSLAGLVAVQQGDQARARAELQQALQADPHSREALEGLVALELAAGNERRAVAMADEFVAAHPRDARALLLAARLHAATQDTKASEGLLRRALDADPHAYDAYHLLGQLYVSEDRLGDAAREFERWASSDPTSVAAGTMAGMVAELHKDPERARRHYEAVLAADPHAALAANNLAWYHAERGTNLDVALHLAQTAKRLLPGRPEISNTLGWVYFKKGMFDLAVTSLRESVEQQPKSAVFAYQLGLAYEKAGEKPRALEALKRALTLDASFPGASEAKAAIARLEGRDLAERRGTH